MNYFKKNLLKNFILEIYIIFNSFKVIINNLFGLFKFKKEINVFYGGSLKGSIGGTLVKVDRLNRSFKNRNLNFNIVYLLSNSLYLNKFSLMKLKKSKIPIIHNQNGVFYKGWYGEGWEDKNKKMATQYNLADYVFYQSNFSKFCAEKYLCQRKGPSQVLYNAVDNNFFKQLKKKQLGKELKILVTGKYQNHLYYSIEFAIEILNQLIKNKINSKINFAGYYDDFVKQKSLKLAKKYNILDKINFSGTYSQKEASLVYNSADIYFYFVHQSNCPNSVIEAMSCGLPILTTNTGGLPEIVDIFSGICLNTQKSWDQPFVPEINDAIISVQKIINNYGDYSNNSINKVAKDHNINSWVKTHKEVFRRFL